MSYPGHAPAVFLCLASAALAARARAFNYNLAARIFPAPAFLFTGILFLRFLLSHFRPPFLIFYLYRRGGAKKDADSGEN